MLNVLRPFFLLLVLYCYLFNFRPVSCRLQTIRSPPGVQTAASFAKIQLPLQKLLFSATMTHSPEKLAPLQLYQPILFTVTGSVTQTNDAGESTTGMRCFEDLIQENVLLTDSHTFLFMLLLRFWCYIKTISSKLMIVYILINYLLDIL